MKHINKSILRAENRIILDTILEQFNDIEGYEGAIPRIEHDLIMENTRKFYQNLYLLQKLDEQSVEEIKGVEPAPPTASVQDKSVAPETNDFSQRHQESREKSFGLRLRQMDPSDLKSMININDKLIFLNELFDGNMSEYKKAIENLNNARDKREAFEFLDRLLKENRWNSEADAFMKFREMVELRFRTNL